MSLTANQKTAVKTAINAETDPTVVAARNAGDMVTLQAWCNGVNAPAVPAWIAAASRPMMFEAINISQYDALTQGKRDAWALMMGSFPVDFRRNKMRNGVDNIWGTSQSAAILSNLLENATRAEVYITPNIAGNQKTTNTVTGLDRSFVGTLSIDDITEAMR